jgi:hypothetical protein
VQLPPRSPLAALAPRSPEALSVVLVLQQEMVWSLPHCWEACSTVIPPASLRTFSMLLALAERSIMATETTETAEKCMLAGWVFEIISWN